MRSHLQIFCGSFAQEKSRSLSFALGSIFLVACVYWVFHEVVHFEFLNWDDPGLLNQDPRFLHSSWSTLGELLLPSSFGEGAAIEYAPIRDLSYWLDIRLWGWPSHGFHRTNLVLHVLNAILVFALLRRFSRGGLAILGALIWSLHPLGVEAVAWVSARKDLLAGTFFLASVLCILSRRYFWAVLCGGASILSKISSVGVGGMAWLPWQREVAWKKRFFSGLVLIVLAGGLGYLVVSVNLRRETVIVAHPIQEWWAPWPSAFQILSESFLRILVPIQLSARYVQRPDLGWADSSVWTGAFLFFGLLAGAAFLLYKKRASGLGLAWVLATWMPYWPFFPTNIWMADRYLYLPLVGLVFSLVTELEGRKRQIQAMAVGLGLIVCIPLGMTSYRRTLVWRNSLSLWSDTVKKSPELYYVWANLGMAQKEAHQLEEAERSFQKAIQRNPTWAQGWADWASVIALQGDSKKARSILLHVENDPQLRGQEKADSSLAHAWLDLREPLRAEPFLLSYLARHPSSSQAWANLGTIWAETHREDQALEAWRKALELHPQNPAARMNRARYHFRRQECEAMKQDLHAVEQWSAKDLQDRDWLLAHCV